MPIFGYSKNDVLPSVWTEARGLSTLHNERGNIPQIITRSEADAISHNAAGPVRRTTQLVTQASWREVDQPRPQNHRYSEEARQNYSALAQNQSNYHHYDYLSFDSYNHQGRGSYNAYSNPVVLDKII
ncbi:hypothetical protein C4J81_11985 [Deltaproteobacteria bacterium Smac51]|nr:hypothetical protein C4J81_11985 [Deltaproteobacteria bacterium Smac51]